MADMRPCPECGGDLWKMRDHARVLRELHRYKAEAEKLAAENGILRSQARLREIEQKQAGSAHQQKIVRQSRAIKRLEEKLREAQKRPYEGATLDQTP